jgi:hypothetical protein
VVWLNCIVVIFLVFWETSLLISIVAVSSVSSRPHQCFVLLVLGIELQALC